MFARLPAWVRNVFRGRVIERDLDEELRATVDQLTAEKIDAGLSPSDARRRALIELGGVDQVKEQVRDVRAGAWLEGVWDDVRHALRALRRTPGFAATAVLTLALGIGANTAIVSLANGLIFRDLGVPNLDRLVAFTKGSRAETNSIARFALTTAEARQIEDLHIPAIDLLFTSDPLVGALSGAATSRVTGEVVSGNYFQALALRPIAGRLLTPEDDRDDTAGAAVVISERLWRQSFNANASAIGTQVRMAGYPLTIVGVVGRSFHGTWLPTMLSADVWVPRAVGHRVRTVQGASAANVERTHRTFARVLSDRALFQVNAALASLSTLPGAQSGATRSIAAVPAVHAINFDDFIRPGLLIGSAVVALASLVFFIACANLANCLLARTTGRMAEVGVRLALGAGRRRVFRLVFVEVVILTVCAGLMGVVITFGLTRAMLAFPMPELDGMRVTFDPSPDWRVFSYALAIATAAALAVGLAPAWRAARANPLSVMTTGSPRGSRHPRRILRTVLVSAQMAMSIVVVVLAGIYIRSALEGASFNPGYDVSSSAMASVDLRLHNIEELRGRTIQRRMLESARMLTGVESAAVATGLPAVGNMGVVPIRLEGEASAGVPRRAPGAQGRSVFLSGRYTRSLATSPGLFETLRIPLLRGRDFTEADHPGGPHVVIVGESVAKHLWPGQDPIGRRVIVGLQDVVREVVGVAADVAVGLSARSGESLVYLPLSQDYSPRVTLVVRAAQQPAAMVEPLRRVVRAVDSEVAVFNAQTVADGIGVLLTPIRVTAIVLGSLGLLALAIALLGVYGLVGYVAGERTREFGIRKALGATRVGIYAIVIRSSIWMLTCGLALGLTVAFIAAAFLRNLVYGVSSRDPFTFVAVPVILLAAGIGAAFVAARRAARVEPSVALRVS